MGAYKSVSGENSKFASMSPLILVTISCSADGGQTLPFIWFSAVLALYERFEPF
jgi:hypothetical protein